LRQSGKAGTESLIVPEIPGIKPFGVSLSRAGRDQEIVDGATHNSCRGGLPQSIAVFFGFETYRGEVLAHCVEEPGGLGTGYAMRRRNPSQCRIRFDQAMRGAKGSIGYTLTKQSHARGMAGMISKTRRDENGGIEEKILRKRPKIA
jgi:hypothetical protein